jgi:hypothetical protein
LVQFPGTGGTGRTASDDNDLLLNHTTPWFAALYKATAGRRRPLFSHHNLP